MKKTLQLVACLLLSVTPLLAQQGFTFNRISTDDGIGLASNVVYSTYQDKKGFIWAGTANGLQRFDGSKFIRFTASNINSPRASSLTKILPYDSSSLWLCFPNLQEIGIYHTATLRYTTVAIKSSRPINNLSGINLWQDSRGETFLFIDKFGLLHYDKKQAAFIDDNYFQFPEGWIPGPGLFEDTLNGNTGSPAGITVFRFTMSGIRKCTPNCTIRRTSPY